MTLDRSHSDTVGRVANKVRVQGGLLLLSKISLFWRTSCTRDFLLLTYFKLRGKLIISFGSHWGTVPPQKKICSHSRCGAVLLPKWNFQLYSASDVPSWPGAPLLRTRAENEHFTPNLGRFSFSISWFSYLYELFFSFFEVRNIRKVKAWSRFLMVLAIPTTKMWNRASVTPSPQLDCRW